METHRFSDWFITSEIIMIGLTEGVHLCGLLFGWTFSRCALFLGAAAGAALAFGLCIRIIKRHKRRKSRDGRGFYACRQAFVPQEAIGGGEGLLYALFLFEVLSQLIFIRMGNTVYVERDMTAETVGSFLAADGIYRVNPMTGLPYQAGMPFRIKILCLPTLYAGICRVTGFDPATVVQFIVPEITLISCYAAFSALGRCLFPQDQKKRACFLVAAAFLVWTGSCGFGMDGFNLLCCGWRGETIRNCVLAPWLLSLCLRRKWKSAALCVLAEACIVWTLYGFGVCVALMLGMAAAQQCCKALSGKGRGR